MVASKEICSRSSVRVRGFQIEWSLFPDSTTTPTRIFKWMTLMYCKFCFIALLTGTINSHYRLSSWIACLCLNSCEHISGCARGVVLACSKKINITINFLCTHFLNCTILLLTNISSEASSSLKLCEYISGCAHGDAPTKNVMLASTFALHFCFFYFAHATSSWRLRISALRHGHHLWKTVISLIS